MWWNYLSIPKLQGYNHLSLGMDKYFHHKLYQGCDYLSMLNHINKMRGSSLVQVMARRLFGAKPLPEPILTLCQFDPWWYLSQKTDVFFQESIFWQKSQPISGYRWYRKCEQTVSASLVYRVCFRNNLGELVVVAHKTTRTSPAHVIGASASHECITYEKQRVLFD